MRRATATARAAIITAACAPSSTSPTRRAGRSKFWHSTREPPPHHCRDADDWQLVRSTCALLAAYAAVAPLAALQAQAQHQASAATAAAAATRAVLHLAAQEQQEQQAQELVGVMAVQQQLGAALLIWMP